MAAAIDIGGQDIAFDTHHEGTALPTIAADSATKDAAGVGRAADRSEIVIDRGAADRAPRYQPSNASWGGSGAWS